MHKQGLWVHSGFITEKGKIKGKTRGMGTYLGRPFLIEGFGEAQGLPG